MKMLLSRAGFLDPSSSDTLGPDASLVCERMSHMLQGVGSSPVPYPLDTSGSHPIRCENQRCLQTLACLRTPDLEQLQSLP